MAQIIYDALGKKWAVAFMSLIAVGQYLMSVSIMIALSRQIWSLQEMMVCRLFIILLNTLIPRLKYP